MPRKNEFGKNVKVLQLTNEQIEAAVKRAEANSKNWTPWPDDKERKQKMNSDEKFLTRSEIGLIKNNLKFKEFMSISERYSRNPPYDVDFYKKYKKIYEIPNDELYEEYGNAFIRKLKTLYDEITSVAQICKNHNVEWKDLYISHENIKYEDNTEVVIYERYTIEKETFISIINKLKMHMEEQMEKERKDEEDKINKEKKLFEDLKRNTRIKMKFNKTEVIDENTRIVTKFLLFPLCINGETRWLETVKFEMKYSVFNKLVNLTSGWKCSRWIDSEPPCFRPCPKCGNKLMWGTFQSPWFIKCMCCDYHTNIVRNNKQEAIDDVENDRKETK